MRSARQQIRRRKCRRTEPFAKAEQRRQKTGARCYAKVERRWKSAERWLQTVKSLFAGVDDIARVDKLWLAV